MRKIIIILIWLIGTTATSAQDYSSVYIIGSATASGWDLATAQSLSPVAGKDAIFEWEGHLKTDEFKFVTTNTWYWPGYLATTAGQQLQVGQSYNLRYSQDMIAEDYKFIPSQEGDYKLTLDLKNLTLTVAQGKPQQQPTALWIKGTAVPGEVQALTMGSAGLFSYNGRLNRGTLHIMSTAVPTDTTIYYLPYWEASDIQDGSPLVRSTDASAPGFWVEAPNDWYRLRLNLQALSLNAAPFKAPYALYLIGGATQAGWNAADAIAFAQDIDHPFSYSLITELKTRTEFVESNLFKILGQPDWNPRSLHPTAAGQSILEATTFRENGDDTKWSVPQDKQGMYAIDIDLWQQTMAARFLYATATGAKDQGNSTTAIDAPQGKDDGFRVTVDHGNVVVSAPSALSNARLLTLSGERVDSSDRKSTRVKLGQNLAPGVYVVAAQMAGRPTRVSKVVVR